MSLTENTNNTLKASLLSSFTSFSEKILEMPYINNNPFLDHTPKMATTINKQKTTQKNKTRPKQHASPHSYTTSFDDLTSKQVTHDSDINNKQHELHDASPHHMTKPNQYNNSMDVDSDT